MITTQRERVVSDCHGPARRERGEAGFTERGASVEMKLEDYEVGLGASAAARRAYSLYGGGQLCHTPVLEQLAETDWRKRSARSRGTCVAATNETHTHIRTHKESIGASSTVDIDSDFDPDVDPT